MPSTFPPFKLSLLSLILAMVMSSQFQQAESLLEEIPNLKFWDNKFAYEKLGQVANDSEGQANDKDSHSLKAQSALKNKPSSKQVRSDMKALKDCEKNFGKMDAIKNDIKSLLAHNNELATIIGDRDDFRTYLSNLKGTIQEKKRKFKNMKYHDTVNEKDYYGGEEGFNYEKNEVGVSVNYNKAKLKLLKQLMDNHGYQAFMATYEICTESLDKFEGENAIEAKRICDKYLGPIKQNFKEAGIDLDSIREAHFKEKESDMQILEDFQKLANTGQLNEVVEKMREVRKTSTYVFGTWEAYNRNLLELEELINQARRWAKHADTVPKYEKQLNVMKKLGNGGFKTVVLMNEICRRKLENFKGSEKTKAKKVCKQVEQLYKDVVKKNSTMHFPRDRELEEWMKREN